MGYFIDANTALSLKQGDPDIPNSGLRPGQMGALFASGAHFIERREPAIVSLPTGYGKTAVMSAVPFILRARRVLVIVPSSALRKQAAGAFKDLGSLRRLGCLPDATVLASPAVASVESKLASAEQWQSLQEFDVVVSTAQAASPLIEGVVSPPEDLFDLVLMDEGHHSPAVTWAAFIEAFPHAKHILFTATAFRRDKRQLPGRVAFSYSLKKAVQERAFGRVNFVPVEVDPASTTHARDNVLIAKAVEIFRRDQAAGRDHRIFARTDSTAAADDLAVRYAAAGLRVRAVSSRRSKRQIEAALQDLDEGTIDGIVCVDMLGEGFDFPRFKIAVLHVAHKSLVPTLQFIGRFARTNDARTGDATFIAIPAEVNSESEILYRAGVDWDVLLADVAEARQTLTVQENEVLQRFVPAAVPAGDYEAANASAMRLGRHVAAFRVRNVPDFSSPPHELGGLVVRAGWVGLDDEAGILIMSEVRPPEWYVAEHLIDSRHECVLMRFFPREMLLYICSTDRSAQVYEKLLEHFVAGEATSLPYQTVMRVRNGITEQEFYNVGVRSISPTTTAESYRIMAGRSADRGIRQSDASNFAQGHFMGRGKLNGAAEVVGASARGRMWAPGRDTLAGLLTWIDSLHGRLTAPQVALGRSGLDLLICGETIELIPEDTCAADWNDSAYDEPVNIRFERPGDDPHSPFILDLDITSFTRTGDGKGLYFTIGDETAGVRLQFRIDRTPQFQVADRNEFEAFIVQAEGVTVPLIQWLEEHPLRFFTKELHFFQSTSIYRRTAHVAVSPDSLAPRDWAGCEIRVEFDYEDANRNTVQAFLRSILVADAGNSFIIYDHRSGEAADFIVGREEGGRLTVRLYHCKGAGGDAPSGERVDDVYELAGQSVKSSRFQIKEQLLRHVRRRTQPARGRGHSPFVLGDREAAISTIERYAPIDIRLEVFAVQPGLSAADLRENVSRIMAAANDSCAAQSVALKWMISA